MNRSIFQDRQGGNLCSPAADSWRFSRRCSFECAGEKSSPQSRKQFASAPNNGHQYCLWGREKVPQVVVLLLSKTTIDEKGL